MTNYRKHTLSTAILIMSALLLSACYKFVKTTKPIELEPPEIQHKIRRGNKVYIQTKDGRALILQVSHVTSEAIIGIEIGVTEVEAIPFDQIETLDKEVDSLRRMSEYEIEESAKAAVGAIGLWIVILILLAG